MKVQQKLSLQATLFTTAVSICGLGALIFSVCKLFADPVRADWMLLLVLIIVTGSWAEISLPGARSKISLTDGFIYIGILMLGPWAGTVLASLDGMVRSRGFAKRMGTLGINLGAMNLAVLAASISATSIFGPLTSLVETNAKIGQLMLCLGLLCVVTYAINTGIVATGMALIERRGLIKTWTENYLWVSPAFFVSIVAAGAVCEAITHFGFYSFVVGLPILLMTYVAFKTYFGKVEESNQHIKKLSKLYLATLESLTMAIDAKDQMTEGHIRRVRALAEGLGRAVNYPENQLEGLKAAALLHDIGKLAVPEYILNKREKLTPAEFSKVMVHPVVAADILSNVEFPYEVVPIVKHHHEKYDGTGYPSRLKGEAIPFGARILTIVDCYDALTHSRPHRPRYKRAQALELMRRESGQTFDPVLLDKFFGIISDLDESVTTFGYEKQHSESAAFSLDSDAPFSLIEGISISERSPAERALRGITAAQREVLSLYEISQTLGSALRLSEVLAIIGAKVEKIANFTTLILYLSEGGKLRAEHAMGKNSDLIKGTEIRMGEGDAGRVANTRQLMIGGAPGPYTSRTTGALTSIYHSTALFPLVRQDNLVGVLALYSIEHEAYSADEVRLLEAVSGHAATAVYNALAFERTQEFALTDNLTGLPNSRYMYSFYEQERSRAERQDSPLVLMMMDLDGFKKINDTYGHHVGDDILRRTAQILRRRLRLGDTLIRYAGDEFVAVLHQATPDVVIDLKQRLQTAVDCFAHEVRPGRVARIGISIGHATLGEDGYAIDELMEVADQRMYDDKIARKRMLTASRMVAAPLQDAF
jgi:diguanylate cyclase (GGDEF)-like protein/putative nucleotidyltransferase with HDIG domain